MSRKDQKTLRRRQDDFDEDEEMPPASDGTIAQMLDAVRATKHPWTVHKGTSVCYHTGRCKICTCYVEHLLREKEE
jgi:hypothetical protein